uniref:Uncharacterized protein n=1 Tax=Moniliophthora roreri TaxID=221103 RepID=A0A0W0FL36_MONRR
MSSSGVWRKPPTLIPIPGQKISSNNSQKHARFRVDTSALSRHGTTYHRPIAFSLSSTLKTEVTAKAEDDLISIPMASQPRTRTNSYSGSLTTKLKNIEGATPQARAKPIPNNVSDSTNVHVQDSLRYQMVELMTSLEKCHKRFNKLKRKLEDFEECVESQALANTQQSQTPEIQEAQIHRVAVTINLRQDFDWRGRLERLFRAELYKLPPVYEHLPDRLARMNPLSLSSHPRFHECLGEIGYERALEERLAESVKHIMEEASLQDDHKTRLFWLDDQRCLAIGPMSQENMKHNFKLTSPFDLLDGEERPLFFESGHHKCRQLFYAGSYKSLNLSGSYQGGFVYKGGNVVLKRLAHAVMSSQVGGPALRFEETISMLKDGEIRLGFLCLYCTGFDHDLYASLTSGTSSQASAKRAASPIAESTRKGKKLRL